MIQDIFRKENVLNFFKDMVLGIVYQKKNIPNTISDERIDSSYYSILMGMDAIIKYAIIVKDMDQFDEYLTQVQLLLRKIDQHHEIKIGIHKLIISCCQKKLGLLNLDSPENKKIILQYIYRKYITEGYFFHSFPSVFKDEVLNQGLNVNNYNFELEALKEVNQVFEKNKIFHVFSKELEVEKPYFTVCDSPFMGCYYAYHTPYFLNEMCTDLMENNINYKLDAFFKKDKNECTNNIMYFMKKKDLFHYDMEKVINFLDKEWNLFSLNQTRPIMCCIKRSVLNHNSLNEIDSIIESLDSEDLVTSVTKILEFRFNQEKVFDNISKDNFEILYLPTIEELGFSKDLAIKEEDNSKSESFMNDYGNTTIIALIGVLLITIGIIITIIMIGR